MLKEQIESFTNNQKISKELQKLGIKTVSDLLFHFPFRYENFSHSVNISEITPGEQISIRGTIKDIKAFIGFRGRVSRAEALVSDETGTIKVVWFNQPYLNKTFSVGDEIFLSGVVSIYKNIPQLQNPIYEKIGASSEQIHTGRIIPIYRLTANLPLRTLRGLIYKALQALPEVEETLPEEILKNMDFPELGTTIKNLHFPDNDEDLAIARKRMAFEEIFQVQLAVQKHLLQMQKQKANPIAFNKNLIQDFTHSLPFELTADQKRAAWEILQDLEKSTPMNRLLEGDVGSGKTLVAFIAALETLQAGKQVILLCPTEILGQQHYKSALKYFEDYTNISLILFTSKVAQLNGKKTNRANLLEEIEHGGAQLIISTHAALQKEVTFKSIGLVIIDEQHRFGVRQRSALKQKSHAHNPHLLSMTATPIPRTLRLTLFGDLQVSQIKQMPKDRKKIITKLVAPENRGKAYDFVQKQIQAGRQAFVVTPLIEESDKLGVKTATAEYKNLQNIFKQFKVGLLHGKMKSAEKEKIMSQFLANEIQILVSTSVIEVGVDVPNASVMIIEGADRFGLAQLHQFRGRVGRSTHQSYAFLFTENPNPEVHARLDKFANTTDGFALAELDLQTRGFGNIFGEEQSGFYFFKFYRFDQKDLANAARERAKTILQDDPDLKKYQQLREKIAGKIIHFE